MNTETPDLSIIIPAYNEEKRLPPTLERMVKNLRTAFPGSFEIIVVDDGSRDNTSSETKRFARSNKEVRLISNANNQGRGVVMKQGVLGATGRYILDTDADGSVDDEAIPRFYAYMESHPEIDMVIGSRTMEGARILIVQPWLRVALGNIFTFLAWIMFGWKMIDRVNGFKFFRKHVAHDIFPHLVENTFFGEAEVTFVTERRGWKVTELPVLWSDHRDSRIRPWKESYRSFFGMFRILYRSWKGQYSADLQSGCDSASQ